MAQNINVDVTPNLFQPTLYYHQGDIGRAFTITISTKDGYTIPSGATVKIEATKPSGLGFSVSGTLSGNVVSFVSTEGMTDEYGRFPAQLKITSGNDILYTANFLMVGAINTHPASVTDGTAEQVISEITLLVERAETAASTAATDAANAAQVRVDEMMNYLPTEVTNLKSDLDSFKEHIDGQLPNPIFENGDIYIPNGSGIPEYYDSSTRLRTRQGTSFYLEAGTVISLSDYTNWRFGLAKADGGGTYTAIGWQQRNYIIPSSGQFIMQITKVPEATVSPSEVNNSDLLKITYESPFADLVDSSQDYKSRKRSIDYYDCGAYKFELGDLYVDGSGHGEYYDSSSRMRTIRDNPISLKRGEIAGLSDYSRCVYNLRQKISAGQYTEITEGWSSANVLIPNDGDYEVLIRYSSESTITDADAVEKLFFVKRKYGIVREDTNVENLTTVFQEELKTTIESARAKTTSRGLMFGIITDTHLDNTHIDYYNQTMENLERLSNGLQFNGIFHLGDIVNGYSDTGITKFHLQYAVDRLLKIGKQNTYITVGNHDNNNGAGDSKRLKDYELYSYIQRFNEHYVYRTMDSSNSVYESPTSNYYVDYPSMKIRMIMFDSCYYGVGFSDGMMEWIEGVFSEAPNDYHFILFTHASTESKLNGGVAIGNADAFKAILQNYANRIYCYVHGHSHYDYVGYDNGFAQIALCCTVPNHTVDPSVIAEGGVQPTRTIGTVTQDCISVIIILPEEQKVELVRFGAGDDRTIPFRQ